VSHNDREKRRMREIAIRLQLNKISLENLHDVEPCSAGIATSYRLHSVGSIPGICSDRRLSTMLVSTFADRWVSRGQRGGSPTAVILFSRPEPLLFLSSSSSIVLTRLGISRVVLSSMELVSQSVSQSDGLKPLM
jgi:hypothetical protein